MLQSLSLILRFLACCRLYVQMLQLLSIHVVLVFFHIVAFHEMLH
jgi:hypothetical protein